MRSILQTIAAGCAVLFCASAAAPERIEYTLTPILQGGALVAVQYDLQFRGDADGESTLRVPDSWGGQSELWKSIAGLEIVSGATMRAGEGAAPRVLIHRPNARIHVRYRVIQDWEGAPRAELGNIYRPTIQSSYFHLIGEGSIVTPGEADNATPVRFRVRNLPRGWTFASDLEHEGLRLQDVWSSVAVGGDFRVLRDPATGVRLAIRGQWSFTDADFLSEASRIIGAQRQFWSDPAAPFLITVLHLDGPEGWVSLGGTGLTDAFAFFAQPTARRDRSRGRFRTRRSIPGSRRKSEGSRKTIRPCNTGCPRGSRISTRRACSCAPAYGRRSNTPTTSTRRSVHTRNRLCIQSTIRASSLTSGTAAIFSVCRTFVAAFWR